MINRNIQSGIALAPSAISIEAIEMENYEGKINDVKNIVTKIELQESLYSPVLILNLDFNDSANFMQEFPIIGQEKIKLRLSRIPVTTEEKEKIELDFIVTKYPIYGKNPKNEIQQVYSLKAISPHGYFSSFKKISRSYKDPSATEIKKILVEDLNFDESKFNVYGNEASSSKGVINIQSPLNAVEHFRSIARDDGGAPFFLYQLLNGDISFTALTQLFDKNTNPIYRSYVDARQFSTENKVSIAEEYDQRQSRILSVASNLNVSKYHQSRGGSFASQNNFLDWSNKSFQRFNYDYHKEITPKVLFDYGSLNTGAPFSDESTIFDLPINKLPEQHVEYIATNQKAYDSYDNYGNAASKNVALKNAHENLLNSYTHDITLFGDFFLNPGRKIELKFPNAVDPELNGGPEFDKLLSGNYLITSAVHRIQDGEYFTEVRVKKDSLDLDI
jgi:hypothetical protein